MWGPWFYLRTCLEKRIAKLQQGLDRFEAAPSLSTLQERILVRTQHDCVTIPQFHIPSRQSKHLRMKDKLVSIQDDLRGFSNQIDEIYAKGVVDGFTEEPLNSN